MITDIHENINKYVALYPQLAKYIEYTKNNDINAITKTVEFNGIKIIPITSAATTENFDENILEAHKKLMDVHITLAGLDVMAYADLETETKISKEYSDADDYLLATSEVRKILAIPQNYFCIVPNNFAHMALYKFHADVKKVVVKMPI